MLTVRKTDKFWSPYQFILGRWVKERYIIDQTLDNIIIRKTTDSAMRKVLMTSKDCIEKCSGCHTNNTLVCPLLTWYTTETTCLQCNSAEKIVSHWWYPLSIRPDLPLGPAQQTHLTQRGGPGTTDPVGSGPTQKANKKCEHDPIPCEWCRAVEWRTMAGRPDTCRKKSNGIGTSGPTWEKPIREITPKEKRDDGTPTTMLSWKSNSEREIKKSISKHKRKWAITSTGEFMKKLQRNKKSVFSHKGKQATKKTTQRPHDGNYQRHSSGRPTWDDERKWRRSVGGRSGPARYLCPRLRQTTWVATRSSGTWSTGTTEDTSGAWMIRGSTITTSFLFCLRVGRQRWTDRSKEFRRWFSVEVMARASFPWRIWFSDQAACWCTSSRPSSSKTESRETWWLQWMTQKVKKRKIYSTQGEYWWYSWSIRPGLPSIQPNKPIWPSDESDLVRSTRPGPAQKANQKELGPTWHWTQYGIV